MIDDGPPAGDDDGESRFELEYDAETPPSIGVVQAVCAIEDIDPTEFSSAFGVTLFDYVNPDALDTILADASGDVTVEFAFEDYHVRIEDTGRILVEKRDQP